MSQKKSRHGKTNLALVVPSLTLLNPWCVCSQDVQLEIVRLTKETKGIEHQWSATKEVYYREFGPITDNAEPVTEVKGSSGVEDLKTWLNMGPEFLEQSPANDVMTPSLSPLSISKSRTRHQDVAGPDRKSAKAARRRLSAPQTDGR